MTSYVCPACRHGALAPGNCPSCLRQRRYVQLQKSGDFGALPLASVAAESVPRLALPGFPSIESVMGGGLVCGSVTLVYGAAGLGKTRLALRIAEGIVRLRPHTAGECLYLSSEQTLYQLKLTAMLVGMAQSSVMVGYQPTLEGIVGVARNVKPRLLVVDSIQDILAEEASVVPRGRRLVALARELGCALLIMSHETKEGDYAAPRTLEHTVDAMVRLWRHHGWLVWEVTDKYRYGATGGAALLEDDGGMIHDAGHVTTGAHLRGSDLQREAGGGGGADGSGGARAAAAPATGTVEGAGGDAARVRPGVQSDSQGEG